MKHDFKVGDRVVVRDWDDIAGEYGTDFEGDIYIVGERCFFTRGMKRYCGMEFEVGSVDMDGYISLNKISRRTFSPSMLRHAGSEPEGTAQIDVDAFLGILGVM